MCVDDGLGGVQDESVYRQEPDARHRELVVEDADIATEAVDLHRSSLGRTITRVVLVVRQRLGRRGVEMGYSGLRVETEALY